MEKTIWYVLGKSNWQNRYRLVAKNYSAGVQLVVELNGKEIHRQWYDSLGEMSEAVGRMSLL